MQIAINLLRSEMDEEEYEICKHCDHFVDTNPSYELFKNGRFHVAEFLHMDNGEKDHDHDAEPSGIRMKLRRWKKFRPDLFIPYEDGIGPNSKYHRLYGDLSVGRAFKLYNDMTLLIGSLGDLFEVRYIAHTPDEANLFCDQHPEAGVIGRDTHGRIYVANLQPVGQV